MPPTRQPRKSDPAVCDVCGCTVSRGTDLPRHRKKHLSSEERAGIEYHCPVSGCTYTCLQKSNLTTHMNTHTKRKPSKCPDCSFASGDPGSRTRHRRRAHGYEPKKRNQYVAAGTKHDNTSIDNDGEVPMVTADSPESSLGSTTDTTACSPMYGGVSPITMSPSPSQQCFSLPTSPPASPPVSPPVSPILAHYVLSPIFRPVQEFGVTPRISAPALSCTESRITLPGVSEMLSGASHWQNNGCYVPHRRSLSPCDERRHPFASTSTAASICPSSLLDYQPSAYTYPPPLPPVEYSGGSRAQPSTPTYPPQMEDE